MDNHLSDAEDTLQ